MTLLASVCGGALHLNPLQLSLAQITLSGIKLVLKKKSFLHTLNCINQRDKAKKRKGEFSKRARLKILGVLCQANNEYWSCYTWFFKESIYQAFDALNTVRFENIVKSIV